MLRIVLLLVVCAVSAFAFYPEESEPEGPPGGDISSRMKEQVYKDIPECMELASGDGMYVVPNCNDEVNSCLEGAHKKAQECVMLEMRHWMKVPKARECHKTNRPLLKEWFRASCKWHLSLVKCMGGEEAGAEFDMADPGDLILERPKVHHHQAKECWTAVKTQTRECNKQAVAECTNYKACAGKGEAPADERLAKWFDVANKLKHDKHSRSKAMLEGFKTCMGDELAAHGPAERF